MLHKFERGLEEERSWISRTEEDERPDASGIVWGFFFNHTATDSRGQQEVCSQPPALKICSLEREHQLIMMKLIFSIILSIKSKFLFKLSLVSESQLYHQKGGYDEQMKLQLRWQSSRGFSAFTPISKYRKCH